MTATWPAVTADHDLGDMTALTARFRPFSDSIPAPRRDPALGPEPTVEEILAECRQIRADLDLAVRRSREARGADTGRAAA